MLSGCSSCGIVLIWCLFIGVRTTSTSDDSPVVILVSFDGFRYDYIDEYRDVLPTLTNLAKEGVRADYVQNVFPTETFPNHYSIVTGLYAEHHGIIGNDMYDPVFKENFSMITNDSKWWQSGEPIWVTNEKNNQRSGVCYWPGYDQVIHGYPATYRPMNASFKPPYAYTDHIMPWKDRIDLIIGWLNGTKPPSLALLYINAPDEQGHEFGTQSPQVRNVLKELDGNASYLMQRLKQLDCYNRTNIIFTSDHGMIDYNSSMYVNIDQYVNPDLYIEWGSSSVRLLVTNSSKTTLQDLYDKFKIAEKATKLIMVYKKHEVPDYFHFRDNRRIPDIVVIVKSPHILNTSHHVHYVNITKQSRTYGAHGFSPLVPQMHQYLIAYGPAFKQDYRSGPVYEVDLYSLMCHLLGIKPAENDGDFSRIKHILKPTSWLKNMFSSHQTLSIVVICLTIVTFIVTGVVIVVKRYTARSGFDRIVHFSNKRKENFHIPLIGSDDEDEIVLM